MRSSSPRTLHLLIPLRVSVPTCLPFPDRSGKDLAGDQPPTGQARVDSPYPGSLEMFTMTRTLRVFCLIGALLAAISPAAGQQPLPPDRMIFVREESGTSDPLRFITNLWILNVGDPTQREALTAIKRALQESMSNDFDTQLELEAVMHRELSRNN